MASVENDNIVVVITTLLRIRKSSEYFCNWVLNNNNKKCNTYTPIQVIKSIGL